MYRIVEVAAKWTNCVVGISWFVIGVVRIGLGGVAVVNVGSKVNSGNRCVVCIVNCVVNLYSS